MEPTTADDDAADMAAGSAGRENHTPYRRPPAHPPIESASGGSWFGGGIPVPLSAASGEPGLGSPEPGNAGRATFGFSDGPISPHLKPPGAAPAEAATRPPEPAPPGPVRQTTDGIVGHRVAHHEPPVGAPGGRSSQLVTAGIMLLSLVLIGGGAVAAVQYFGTPSGADVDAVLRSNAGQAPGRTVTAPLGNRTTASFEILAGADAVHLTIGELGDDLYRISTPDDAGVRPAPVVQNDAVQLQVTPDGDGTGTAIDVVLAAKVRWALRFSGYAERQVIDVSGGQVSKIEMVAAMRRAELTLSRATGTVPLKINGAVDQLTFTSPRSSPVRVNVGGGAQTVVAGTRTIENLAPGSTVTPKGWKTADRYDVTAGGRITTLTIATK